MRTRRCPDPPGPAAHSRWREDAPSLGGLPSGPFPKHTICVRGGSPEHFVLTLGLNLTQRI